MSGEAVRFRAPGAAGRVLIGLLTLIAALVLATSASAGGSGVACAPSAAAQPSGAGSFVDQRHAATLLFLPGPIRTPRPLLTEDLQRLPGFAVGLFSPTLGRYSPVQMMLDISQGARVASSLYGPASIPAPGLIIDPVAGAARFKYWGALQRRTGSAPGELRPGLLGCTVPRSGRRIAWVGYSGGPTVTALAAADTSGAVARPSIVPRERLGAEFTNPQKHFDLVIAQLPPGGEGLGVVRRIAAAEPQRLLIVVQAPPDPARTRLLAIAVRGIGGDGGLTSGTTRRNGLVVATDIAPTLLQRLGVDKPQTMQGQPIESAPRSSADQLQKMAARLELIAGRRAPFGKGVLVLFGLILIGVLLAGRAAGHYKEIASRAKRLVALSVLWLPALLLVAAAMRPSRALEVDVAVFGSFALALLSDRLVGWPRAPWLPAFACLALHAVDFVVFSSRFSGQSLLGSNPLYGARFFGVGNELEAVFTVSALIGTGAWMCDRHLRRPAAWFAAAGLAMTLFLGLGRIGADVGGVIMAGTGFGVAALYAARLRPTLPRLLLLVLAPLLVLAAIVGLDALSGGESHLSSTLSGAGGAGDLLTIIDRRFRASVEGARSNGIWLFVLAAVALLVWGWLRRERLLAPLTASGEDAAARRPYRAALAGGVAATVVGALANDSGPAISIIGTIYLLIGVMYLRGRPDGAATE